MSVKGPALLVLSLLAFAFLLPASPEVPAFGLPNWQADLQASGDVDCGGSVDAVDALLILRSVAGLPASSNCLNGSGDVDCSGAIDAVDALLVLRHVAGLPVNLPLGCSSIGGPPSNAASAYEGYASATHNEPPETGDTLTYTITASNLRFEKEPPDPKYPGGVLYELVRGTVTVQVDGTQGDCTISGSFSISGPMNAFQGSIALDVQNNKYAASGILLNVWSYILDCPGQSPIHVQVPQQLWVLTTSPIQFIPDRAFTPGEPLQGSFDAADPVQFHWTSHYEWRFDPVS